MPDDFKLVDLAVRAHAKSTDREAADARQASNRARNTLPAVMVLWRLVILIPTYDWVPHHGVVAEWSNAQD